MTTFLRFFILALTPLLGVTLSFGSALLFGLVFLLVLVSVAALVHFTRDSLRGAGLQWAVLGTGAVVVTLVDLAVSLGLPELRAGWGVYLNLLAFSPLVAVLPLERVPSGDLGAELSRALKTGLLLTLLFSAAALLRETLGAGTFTLIPGPVTWDLPLLHDYPLAILATGAGAFFLSSAAVVAYRAARPKLGSLAEKTEFWGTGGPDPVQPAPKTPEAAKSETAPLTQPAAPKAAAPSEPAGEWGESLDKVVADLPPAGLGDKRRLLVIGSGNGELAYYLSMLCLDQGAQGRGFPFRVRGVDHFSTRIESAIRGVYRDHQIEFIPQALREAWMAKGEDKFSWKVGSEPRLHVQFEVADFQQGPLFFPQPCHLIVLNQGIEYITDDKKAQLLKTVCDNLLPGGALVATVPFPREKLPEGMKRTGTAVFRKA